MKSYQVDEVDDLVWLHFHRYSLQCRFQINIFLVQGQSRQTVFFELALRDRNVQVRFWKSGPIEGA